MFVYFKLLLKHFQLYRNGKAIAKPKPKIKHPKRVNAIGFSNKSGVSSEMSSQIIYIMYLPKDKLIGDVVLSHMPL